MSASPAATAAVSPDMLRAYTSVQNGSDIRGIALDLVPEEKVTLTPSMIYFIGASFGEWLAKHTGKSAGDLRVSVRVCVRVFVSA
jgi:hypothetical protein